MLNMHHTLIDRVSCSAAAEFECSCLTSFPLTCFASLVLHVIPCSLVIPTLSCFVGEIHLQRNRRVKLPWSTAVDALAAPCVYNSDWLLLLCGPVFVGDRACQPCPCPKRSCPSHFQQHATSLMQLLFFTVSFGVPRDTPR